MNRIAILGLGLMGGSLGLALKNSKSFRGEVRGYARRPETAKTGPEIERRGRGFRRSGESR